MYLHDALCEQCFAAFRGTEDARRRQQHSARQLGLLGARSSEAIGAAIGAVGAAGAAASRYFVHGALSGAQHAWAGSAYAAPAPAPGLQVQVPRPEYLPAPLPFEPSYSSSTPIVSEDAGAASRERQQQEQSVLQMEHQIRKLMDVMVEQKQNLTEVIREKDRQIAALQAGGTASNASVFEDAEPAHSPGAAAVRCGESPHPAVSGRMPPPYVPPRADDEAAVAAARQVPVPLDEPAGLPDPVLPPDRVLYVNEPAPAPPPAAQHTRAVEAASAGLPLGSAAASSEGQPALQPASDEPVAPQGPRSLPLTDERVAAVVAVGGYGVVTAAAASQELRTEPGGQSGANSHTDSANSQEPLWAYQKSPSDYYPSAALEGYDNSMNGHPGHMGSYPYIDQTPTDAGHGHFFPGPHHRDPGAEARSMAGSRISRPVSGQCK